MGSAALSCVLTVNAGSSSLKLGLWRGERVLATAMADDLGAKGTLSLNGSRIRGGAHDSVAAFRTLLAALMEIARPEAVGHRLVHGGPMFSAPTVVDARVMRELRTLRPLAPLHLPQELALISAARSLKVPQVVCFDTAFHHTLPERARTLPLPAAMRRTGLRRYGFHGLS
ncbi:MAG TPA: hypothetical protein VI299_12755, partial [Polyangiales bacterium]